MSSQIDLDILRRSLLLHNLSRDELDDVAALMRPRHYRQDTPVFYREDPRPAGGGWPTLGRGPDPDSACFC
jgi:hypothetical protein